ncbi:MAG: hypothetical protein IJG60_00460 [Thermoguttaceae bacterium]|nr:hypothetical protein [Thermoguttaceae bacterium]
MQKFVLGVLTFAALCLSEWAYAQPPGGGRHHSGPPVVRGQAEPAHHQAPAIHPGHIGREQPPRYAPAPPPPPRPVAGPPHHEPAPPPPRHHRSFLEICLPFLSLGFSK